jgi:hypothetical protein
MLQNRRRVFLFVCLIVFVQALYYVVTLQINRTQPNHSDPTSLVYNRSSDNSPATAYQSQPTTVVAPIVVVSALVKNQNARLHFDRLIQPCSAHQLMSHRQQQLPLPLPLRPAPQLTRRLPCFGIRPSRARAPAWLPRRLSPLTMLLSTRPLI